jgi:hypothetical protein
MISCEGSWTAFREKTIVKGILRYFRLERGEYRGFGLGFRYELIVLQHLPAVLIQAAA